MLLTTIWSGEVMTGAANLYHEGMLEVGRT